jgi:hypothetical protein
MKITPWPLLPGLVMGLCLFAASARADTIYTYTGNPFTVFSGLDACPPVCNISGSFNLASPLAAATGEVRTGASSTTITGTMTTIATTVAGTKTTASTKVGTKKLTTTTIATEKSN